MGTVYKVEKNAEKLAKQSIRRGTNTFATKEEQLGKLELTISYNGSVLRIKLGKAESLPQRDSVGSSDPYAKVYLLQPNGSAIFQKNHEQTKVYKNKLNLNFDEEFQFPLNKEEILKSKLVVALWDSDVLSSDDYMSGLRCEMKHFDLDGSFTVQLLAQLQPQGIDGHPGEVTWAEMQRFMAFSETSSSFKTVEQRASRASTTSRDTTDFRTSRASSTSSSSSSFRRSSSITSIEQKKTHGSVTFKVSFDHQGLLIIHLLRAQNLPDKDLVGKSDPYAKVYLIGDNAAQINAEDKHTKTKTHKNNLNPEFNDIFKFKLNLQAIRNAKTVIEIWDDDFGKDQFLCGVMFRMASFNLASEVEITTSLYSGRANGMPLEVLEFEGLGGPQAASRRSTTKFTTETVSHVSHVANRKSRSSSSGGSSSEDETDARSILRKSNNRLVDYIEKARILSQAHLVIKSLPKQISATEEVKTTGRMDRSTDSRLTNELLHESQDKLRLRKEELERLRRENRKLTEGLKEKERLLAEKDRAVWALESDIVGLQGRCTIIQHEFTRIRELETSMEREREFYLEEVEHAKRELATINVDQIKFQVNEKKKSLNAQFSRNVEGKVQESMTKITVPISMIADYKERMMKELREKRKLYIDSVGKMEFESKEILKMYDGIVSARVSGSVQSLRRTSMVQRVGVYRKDMLAIEEDMNNLRSEVARLETSKDKKKAEYEIQLRRKDAEFASWRLKFEEDLKAWFAQYGAEFRAYCHEQMELIIYSKLLEFEESRLAALATSVPRASVSLSKKRSSYRSEDRSVSQFSSRATRKESGYHSPGTKTPGNKTPENMLESRTSTSSDFLMRLAKDINSSSSDDEVHI